MLLVFLIAAGLWGGGAFMGVPRRSRLTVLGGKKLEKFDIDNATAAELAVQAVASRAMRQIVIDDLRARQAVKRGSGAVVHELERAEQMVAAPGGSPEEALAVDQALGELERSEPRLARVVEWHFFGGLTFGEIAEALGLTERTVLRDWRAARALLHVRLAGG